MVEQNVVDEKEELFGGGDSHGSPTLDRYTDSKELESGSDINTLDRSTFSSPEVFECSGIRIRRRPRGGGKEPGAAENNGLPSPVELSGAAARRPIEGDAALPKRAYMSGDDLSSFLGDDVDEGEFGQEAVYLCLPDDDVDEGEFGRDATKNELFNVRDLGVFEDESIRIIGRDSGGGGTRGGVRMVTDGGDSGGSGIRGGVRMVTVGDGGNSGEKEELETGARLSRWRKVQLMLINLGRKRNGKPEHVFRGGGRFN